MYKVYYLTRDLGDGSTAVDFFLDLDLVEELMQEEEYCLNDSYGYFTVPDLGTIDITRRA